MRIRTRTSLGIAASLGALAVAVGAQGASDDKVVVCHGTASGSNSYVLLEINRSGLNGHFNKLDGEFVLSGHGPKNAPDQWVELGGKGGTGLTDQCVTLYNDTYDPDYGSGPE